MLQALLQTWAQTKSYNTAVCPVLLGHSRACIIAWMSVRLVFQSCHHTWDTKFAQANKGWTTKHLDLQVLFWCFSEPNLWLILGLSPRGLLLRPESSTVYYVRKQSIQFCFLCHAEWATPGLRYHQGKQSRLLILCKSGAACTLLCAHYGFPYAPFIVSYRAAINVVTPKK